MHTLTINAYKFDELSDRAKEKARAWWRNGFDDFCYDYIYDDADQVAKILGFDICQTRKTLMDGTVRYDPTIWWSGFSSQGDGACFEGSYAWKSGCQKEIRKYAPQDERLHRIADALQQMQQPYFYKLTGSIQHRGRYYHERSMTCSLEHPDYGWYSERRLPEDDFADICADFAMWIYRQLEKEYEWQMSDECVDELLRINEYNFDENGDCL